MTAICSTPSSTHILHLERGKLTLYKGNYTSFEAQRREAQRARRQGRARSRRSERRELQAFVDRFRSKATKARQAQSRLKMLAKMEPVAAIVDDEVLPIHLPSPRKAAVAADHRA